MNVAVFCYNERMNIPRPLKVLVVDDDQVINNEVEVRLRTAGFFPDHAFDGQSALDKIASLPFDLIVLDLVMPGISGFDVLKEMQDKKIAIPVVVLSTLRQEEDVQRAEKLGARECFAKSSPNFMDEVVKYAEMVSVS